MKHNVVRRTVAGVTAALLGVSVALTATQPAFAAPDERLVVHYALDETSGTAAADQSGNGRDATIVGGPALTGGEGVRLDGVDDHVGCRTTSWPASTRSPFAPTCSSRTAQATPYFIYGFGNTTRRRTATATCSPPATPTAPRSPPATGRPSRHRDQRRATSPAASGRRSPTRSTGNTGTLYEDGVAGRPQHRGHHHAGRDRRRHHDRQLPRPVRLHRRQVLKGRSATSASTTAALTAAEVAALQPTDHVEGRRDHAALDLGDTSARRPPT